MGEAKRKKEERKKAWPEDHDYFGIVDLHVLPPDASINGARIRDLTGDISIPDTEVILKVFRAIAGDREFHVGFCLGDETGVSAIGTAVIERLTMEASDAPLHVVPIAHEDIAWDIVLRHLRSFSGRLLLFVFPNSDVYDAGTAEKYYSKAIRLFDDKGTSLGRLTPKHRETIRDGKAAILGRPRPPKFYATSVEQEDTPWVFRLVTPAGKAIRTAVWNGRRNYAHECPPETARWVGGDRIAIVQVDSPVGVNRRSSLDLTHWLAKDFDGVIHWARDSETFHSILKSFVRLDLESVSAPELPEDWAPEVTILASNTS